MNVKNVVGLGFQELHVKVEDAVLMTVCME